MKTMKKVIIAILMVLFCGGFFYLSNVIHNPNAKDGGTVFRPNDGKDYFLNIK